MSEHLDQETAALAEALVYRLRNRGDGEGQWPGAWLEEL